MAALWVAAYHLLMPAHLIGGVPARMVGRGYLAVDLFFVLSGFVMALTYCQLFAGRFRPRVFAGFLWRRVARLYPIYGAILISRFVYTAWRYGSFDLPRPWIAAPLPHPWTDIPVNLLLVQSWGLAPSSIGPAWSISTEWAAYWAFPPLAAVMLNGSVRAALVGVAASVVLLLATAALLHAQGHSATLDAWNGLTPRPMMRCLAGFTMGLGVWRLSLDPFAARLASRPLMLWAVLACLALMLALRAPDLAIYPLFPAVVLCLAVGRPAQSGLFTWPAALWLGEISYSLYLLHIFLLHPLDQTRATLRLVLPPAIADGVTAALMLAFLLGAADICARCIERPGRRLLTRAVLFKARTP